jgi:hypothetical protein
MKTVVSVLVHEMCHTAREIDGDLAKKGEKESHGPKFKKWADIATTACRTRYPDKCLADGQQFDLNC